MKFICLENSSKISSMNPRETWYFSWACDITEPIKSGYFEKTGSFFNRLASS